MRSTINLAVLALVIERPSYGYELSQRFERRFDGLLAAGRSHIYSALDSLQRERMIEPLPQPAERAASPRQPRIHYRATRDGLRAFRTGLAEQLRANTLRTRALSRLAVLDPEPQRTLELLIEQCDRDATVGDAAGDDGRLTTRLLDEERRMMRAAQLEWAALARRELDALDR